MEKVNFSLYRCQVLVLFFFSRATLKYSLLFPLLFLFSEAYNGVDDKTKDEEENGKCRGNK